MNVIQWLSIGKEWKEEFMLMANSVRRKKDYTTFC